MSEVIEASGALSSVEQDRAAQFREQLFSGTYLVEEAAVALGRHVRTLERLIQRLGVPVYKTGCTRRIKPSELREAMEADARRQMEERQHAMAPRRRGRPPAAPTGTPGRATKPAQAARERPETVRT